MSANYISYISYYDPPVNDVINLLYGIRTLISHKDIATLKREIWTFIGCLVYRINRCCVCYHPLPPKRMVTRNIGDYEYMSNSSYKIKEGKGFHWRCW